MILVSSGGDVRSQDILDFQRLSVDDGLPDNTVRAIIQDRHGFIWLGTQAGLVRCDGDRMRVFQPVEGDSTSLVNRKVGALLEDRQGNIWVGTLRSGLCRYDPGTERFARYVVAPAGTPPDQKAWMRYMAEDPDGNLWIVTSENCLFRFEPANGRVTPIIPGAHWPDSERPRMITSVEADARRRIWVATREGRVHVLDLEGRRVDVLDRATSVLDNGPLVSAEFVHESPDGRIWIAGSGGLLAWDPDLRHIEAYMPRPLDALSGANDLLCLATDINGRLWAGSKGGLQRFDPRSGEFEMFRHDAANPHSPAPGPVASLCCDNSGILWSGHWLGGISRCDVNGSLFEVYRRDPDDLRTLREDACAAVYRDAAGTIWVGTGNAGTGQTIGGLYRMDRDGPFFTRIGLPDGELHIVEAIAQAPGGRLWLGTNSGLWSYDPAQGRFARFGEGDARFDDMRRASVRCLLVEPDGQLWVGTRDDGLWRVGPDGSLHGRYRKSPDQPRGLGSTSVVRIRRDSRGNLWISTSGAGLRRYVPETDDFDAWFDPDGNLVSPADVVENEDGRLWLASTSGLIRLDPETHAVESFTSVNGLPNDFMLSAFRDGHGRLWLSTARGLALLDASARVIRVFDTRDGLPSNDYALSALLDGTGTAWLATVSGLIRFKPDLYRPSTFDPPVVLTELKLSDRPVRPADDSPLPGSIVGTTSLRLASDQNAVTFVFASLDYARTDLVRFRYRLRGLSDEWRAASPVHEAAYNNLAPGRYKFEVQGTNRDGIWSGRQVALDLQVLHPWWATPGARSAWLILAVAAIALLFRLLLARVKRQHALTLRLAEADRLAELDGIKSRFFANLSHEFRTPLTLIEGLMYRCERRPADMTSADVAMIFRNTRRLRKLIDQLLDLARLESGRFTLKWHHDDLGSFIRVLSASFASLAQVRNIEYQARLPDEPEPGWFDQDLVETVVSNLLSNALKFTPEGHAVALEMSVGEERSLAPEQRRRLGLERASRCRDVTISVSNTGTYVPPEQRAVIFDRFVQAASQPTDGNIGTGIGLALVRELAEYMGGSVGLDSVPDAETRFTVMLPLVVTPVNAGAVPGADTGGMSSRERLRRPALADESPSAATCGSEAMSGPADGQEDEPSAERRPTVVLVEDHADLRVFLAGELTPEFAVTTAPDGDAGWRLISESIPDIVVSDVMMPGIDGFALLRKIKETFVTCHIPVVMLTAKAEAESRKEGLRIGADDYLAKPLDPEELRLRMRNLIAQRALLQKRYSSRFGSLPLRELPIESRDDRFIADLTSLVDQHLDDEDFGVDELVREIGMSRTHLHRKLKALTGISAGALIKRQRLHRAAEMLAKKYGNVAEVAFAAGFKSLSHFSTDFREEFGVPPSKYPPTGDVTDE